MCLAPSEARYVDCSFSSSSTIHIRRRSVAGVLDDTFCGNQNAGGHLSHYQYSSGQRDSELHQTAGRSDCQRIIYSEGRALTTTVENIEHIESTSYDGVGVIKVFLQTNVNPSTAAAQLTAVSQTISEEKGSSLFEQERQRQLRIPVDCRIRQELRINVPLQRQRRGLR
jgi:hypothetical protein